MAGLNIEAIRELREAAKGLLNLPKPERKARAVELVRQYLDDPRQRNARDEADSDEGAMARNVFSQKAEFIIAQAENPGDLALKWLSDLLTEARTDSIALDAIRPAISALLRAGFNSDELRAFLADYFEGKVNPKLKTRMRSQDDWIRQQQFAHAATALMLGGLTENAACNRVAEAAALAAVETPKNSSEQSITVAHVRRALRLVGPEKLRGLPG